MTPAREGYLTPEYIRAGEASRERLTRAYEWLFDQIDWSNVYQPGADDPECTCDEYDEYPVCAIHVWIGGG